MTGVTTVSHGEHLSVISAAIPDGRLYLKIKDKAYTAPDVVVFLKHLLAQIPGELVVIWDGSNIHRGPVVEQFLATAQGQRITTYQLPGYAPELNPDEWVWNPPLSRSLLGHPAIAQHAGGGDVPLHRGA